MSESCTLFSWISEVYNIGFFSVYVPTYCTMNVGLKGNPLTLPHPNQEE